MSRLGLLALVAATACTSNLGPPSGTGSLTGAPKTVMSSGANSFTGADGSGTKVLGWTVYLFTNGPGAACNSADTKVSATLGIYTSQAPDNSNKKAQLLTGDISIVPMSPPTVTGQATASMGVDSLVNVQGVVEISDFLVDSGGTVQHISGTITAAGTDGTGNPVNLSGSFVAPNCD